MYNIFHSIISMQAPFNMFVLVVLIGSVAGVLGTLTKQARKYASHRADLQFKRDLVERGLSVDEIERLIATSSPIENSAE